MAEPPSQQIYVAGYAKAGLEKSDLNDLFKDFGTIVDISYKGPYSFIV